MGECPFHRDEGSNPDRAPSTDPPDRGVPRRAFLASALAIGGTSALSAALSAGADASTPAELAVPQGDPSRRPERQHLWSPVGRTDPAGNPAPPAHQLVLLLDYVGSDLEADRETVEASLRQLESAFRYDQASGLLFNVGYSPAYFARHHGGTPDEELITRPRAVSPYADPILDEQDVFLQLASDRVDVLLAAEEALYGAIDVVNGVDVAASFDGVLEVDHRRTVFVGSNDSGKPAEYLDDPNVDPDAPLSMGFASAFTDSIPEEARVTIDEGPWADGTVVQASILRLRLEEWYAESIDDRVDRMFAPEYDPDDVGEFGEGLGAGSGLRDGEGWPRNLTECVGGDAHHRGVVGHAQKVSRARDDDFQVKLLRRDGDVTTAGGGGGLSFNGLVKRIGDWFDVADAMYDTDLDETLREADSRGESRGREKGRESDHSRDSESGDDTPTGHHPRSGIAAAVEPLRRGHFLVPPRSKRSLPGLER